MVISQGVRKLIEEYKLWQKESEVHEDEGVISVDEAAARVATVVSFLNTLAMVKFGSVTPGLVR